MTKTIEVNLPAYWASALVNGDDWGLEGDDLVQYQTWLYANTAIAIHSCSEESYIGRYDGLICDMLTYYSHTVKG